jgi:hypothetical protein
MHFWNFQVIGGVVNIRNYQNKSRAKVRRISTFYTPYDTTVDLAIAKVHRPFIFINTVQGITLASAGTLPPGNQKFYNHQKRLDQNKWDILLMINFTKIYY